jgi:glycosyltransferase involved in cell wall biosynthesis
MPKVIVSVISDLVTDNRVHRTSKTLTYMGFDVLVIGAKKRNSQLAVGHKYNVKRFNMWFQKGFLFYAEWNVRLFFFLLKQKAVLLVANDLDTLPANYLAAKLCKATLVYDTHEYFTEMAELYNRPFVKKIWQGIENRFFPRLKYVFTVNNSVAKLYQQKFNKQLVVVRNIPIAATPLNSVIDFGLPANKKILLMQGAGLNQHRGLEELVQAMDFVSDDFILVFVGSGLLVESLKKMAGGKINQCIFFIKPQPPIMLHALAKMAWCGFSLDKSINLNQQVSLPNKVFEYIAAGIPIIASNVIEVATIVNEYKVGKILNEVTPQAIANAVLELDAEVALYNLYKANTTTAATILNWNNEQKILIDFFNKVITENNISTIG